MTFAVVLRTYVLAARATIMKTTDRPNSTAWSMPTLLLYVLLKPNKLPATVTIRMIAKTIKKPRVHIDARSAILRTWGKRAIGGRAGWVKEGDTPDDLTGTVGKCAGG